MQLHKEFTNGALKNLGSIDQLRSKHFTIPMENLLVSYNYKISEYANRFFIQVLI